MPELAVDPASLLDLAGALGTTADRLAALSVGLPVPDATVGPDELLHALQNASRAWHYALLGTAVQLAGARDQLEAAAVVYEDVEALVSDWSAQ